MPDSVLKVGVSHVTDNADVRLYVGGTTGAADNRVLRSDGAGGFTCQASPVVCDDTGNMSGLGTVACGTVTVTGNVVVSGTVDGRDVSVDGTKLDGVAAGAQVCSAANVQTACAALASALALNAQKIANMANGTVATDGAAFGQVPVASSTTPAIATAAGTVGAGTTWARADHAHPQDLIFTDGPRHATSLVEEFSGGTLNWHTSWRVSQSGAGATLAQDATLPDATHFGVAALPTGTTTTGRCGLIQVPSTQMAYTLSTSSAMYVEWLVYISALSDGTDTYSANIGWGNDPAAESTSGVYFRYDQVTSANWIIVGANAGTRTRTTSATAVVAGAWVRLGISKPAGTTTCEFFVNGVSIGTVSTNLPAVAFSHMAMVLKSLGATSRTLFADYMWAKSTWATPRA